MAADIHLEKSPVLSLKPGLRCKTLEYSCRLWDVHTGR